jgi:GNAT superfamily N-acetyltransferase
MALGHVRPAGPGDAGEIARIQLSTWRTAYRRLLPVHVLNELDEAWLTQRWLEAITAPPSPHHHVLVAVEQPDPQSVTAGPTSAYPVGFAAIGPVDDAALAPGESRSHLGAAVAAVTDLLIEPRWGRRGHGSRLLAACADRWRSDGFTTAVAWAFAEDAAMRAFFESAGWAADGTSRALDVDDLLVPQVRLHTALDIEREPST